MLGGLTSTNKRNGQPRTRRSQLILSYVPDYMVLVVMAVLWGLISKIHPFHRDFSLTDKTIQYPHKPDSVPFYAAVLLCLALPLVVIVVWTGLVRRSFHDMNAGVLGLCMALVLNMMITNTVKNLAGRLRPDFIDRCDLDVDNVREPRVGLLTSAVCRQTDMDLLLDGMRSFPSGHTSFSFAGLTYLALWLGGHLNIGDRRGNTYKSFVSLLPILGAMLIGVSRTMDYRHHWHDVLAGAILGFLMGWFGYLLYYPSPFSHESACPHPPRIAEDSRDLYVMNELERGTVNPGPYGRSANANPTPGAPAMHHSEQASSSRPGFSHHYGPHAALRVPSTPRSMHNSRDSLVR
ncbi:hypothetical protein H4S08_001652 [Coemansia sp. RSA 1365]|nr:hypothetical protein H4S08_001652 [Coemansia sp. RSA 1365]